MILLQEPLLSRFEQCSYLTDKQWRFAYFFASQVTSEELDLLLASGWRKFGSYYFMPSCGDCQQCIPLRIVTSDFNPSKSQRRVLRNGQNIRVEFKPLEYRDDIYDIYQDHSLCRFDRIADKNEFITSFYLQSCPSLQSEYYLNDELIAVGFLDVANRGISSVYFAYKTQFQHLRLGTLSILKEIEYAASQGQRYYYLGYYVADCQRMAYKNRFFPNEKYDWQQGIWISDVDYSRKP